MKDNQYQTLKPNVKNNPLLRVPQREGYAEIERHFARPGAEREVGIVLPVGCGKSGLIALAPFAVAAQRVLVVAPGVQIAKQLYDDMHPSHPNMFCRKCKVLQGASFPEPAAIRGQLTNKADLDDADVVITNIQQLQGEENRWLAGLPIDFFDLILVDEGHHNVAASWDLLRQRFPQAKIINFSATPTRADGQLMAGSIIYSFPIFRAIKEGYVKRLKAVMLNPATLRYVRREHGVEVAVGPDEVRRLGEDDADFRRSIVSSAETLKTIIDCSINKLYELRERTGEQRLKIIASALNYEHCIQITRAYQECGLRAAYVHAKEDGVANERVLKKLKNDELDVIVQVRKLGEGFDHKYLSVAAVCSIFSNLAPFAQFVGRIMRVITQNAPDSPLNEGVVVFHAGANIATRWSDFQEFSLADQEYFDQLLPLETVDFKDAIELIHEPQPRQPSALGVEIRDQQNVMLEEIPLLESDERARKAFDYLVSKGFTPEDFARAVEHSPIAVTKQNRRQAARAALDARIRTKVGQLMHERGVNPKGRDLDRQFLGRDNFVVVKSSFDRHCNEFVGRKAGQRDEFSNAEYDRIDAAFEEIAVAVATEVFDGKA